MNLDNVINFVYANGVYRNQDRSVNLAETVYNEGDNERIPCDYLPDLDLRPWVEIPSYNPYNPYYYHHQSHPDYGLGHGHGHY